ncbi:MAG TPA: hypothetical protein PLL57_04030 [Flavobacteriales bacterium]|nr:hypothetical protein [Flavobacteriales bacterium]
MFVLLGILVCSGSWAQEVHIPLNDGWHFKQVGKGEWYPAEVPGVVQTDLLRQGLIPDFMRGSNIDRVQWIENEDWIYKRTLFVTDTLLRHGHLDLVFKGLDTFAEVYVNDSLIGKADNMFRTWEWPVKALLRKGKNELKVVFRSPIKEGAKLRDAYGIQLPHDNDPSGVSPYIRKAAYQFGWDFCPRLVTSGIWKEVELRGWSGGRIHALSVTRMNRSVSVTVHDLIDDRKAFRAKYVAYLDDVPFASASTALRRNEGLWATFDSTTARPWLPFSVGEQLVHRLRVDLVRKGRVIASKEVPFAFSTPVLNTHADSIGNGFNFSMEGRSFFAKGCNIVPPDLVPSRIADSTWVQQVHLMKAAGMNMVRVWAGGVYPPEAFFHACDTAGIMVWQDFMIAELVPNEGEFNANIREEAWQQVLRLRDHPCLAIMCGNNELRVAWKNWGWQDRYDLRGPDSVRVINTNEELWSRDLQNVTSILGHGRYTSSSPISNWGSSVGLKYGDLHYWGVWHGDSTFSSFKNNVGRFVSEWGFQSYPDSALLAKYIDPDSLYLGSPAVTRLQRSYKTDKPIWHAIEVELGEVKPTTLGSFIEASQRAQAKAYGMAIEAHLAAQPHCMGTLLWQLNDCWPGPSWSIIDYDGNPKPAYEVVKRLYQATDRQ